MSICIRIYICTHTHTHTHTHTQGETHQVREPHSFRSSTAWMRPHFPLRIFFQFFSLRQRCTSLHCSTPPSTQEKKTRTRTPNTHHYTQRTLPLAFELAVEIRPTLTELRRLLSLRYAKVSKETYIRGKRNLVKVI